MEIQINTGNHVKGSAAMSQEVQAIVESTLAHLTDHVSRVEVHLSDENGKKGGGDDKRCVMEARLNHHQPIAVTSEAQTIIQAANGAADKLKRSLEHTLGRLNEHEGRKHLKKDPLEVITESLGKIPITAD